MSYFANMQARQSAFYRRLWQELREVKVFDTHDHLGPEQTLWQAPEGGIHKRLPAWKVFDCAYIHGPWVQSQNFTAWAEIINRQRGTAYLKSLLWAFEELFDLKPPVTPGYLQDLEEIINQAYAGDEKNNDRLLHLLKDHMHAETAILDIFPMEAHLSLPKPIFQPSAGLSSICNGAQVPSVNINLDNNVPYWFAVNKMGKDLADIRTLDDYLGIIDHLIDYLSSQKFISTKFHFELDRPISFPEPDDVSKIRLLFNKAKLTEVERLKFGDYIMHYYLTQISKRWNRPVQFHTGLGRVHDGGSNAINLNNLFQKFPNVKFDILHGNYPWHLLLPGMLHQIPNVYADLSGLCITAPSAAQQLLANLIEIGDVASIEPGHEPSWRTAVFGGNCSIGEGSYGALLMTKDVVCRAMDDLYERTIILERDAVDIAERVLYSNPKRLFGNNPS